MASASISTCTSLASQCRVSQKQNLLLPSNSTLNFLSTSPSLSSNKLSFSPRLTFHSLPKISNSQTAVVDSEPVQVLVQSESNGSESEAAEIVQASSEQGPSREQVFAVVMIGSRQYIVFPGRFIYTQRLKGANANDKIALNKVLLVGTRSSTYIGKPVVTNAVVHATVEEQGLDPKVIVFKYKKKKNYRRNIGHQQPNTLIWITSITGYQDYPAVTLDS
ncbi:50S ribosomal protein L21, chloroplastic-like [Quillaja saponaria]|uniref:50S ribosomal protein L21, chloroplastic-like n=1 Tax=Quillaja saponaria TaxID=32244 RepID=A0AAD7M4G8_QUISA|nr:50S ribosomal protein L21, chloroplastic-like [Quillaja saponaria]